MAVLTGDDTPENLIGSAEADTIRGLGGNDTLQGNGDNDLLEGGTGDDSLLGGDADTLFGGIGHDTLTAAQGSAELHGDDGNDRILMDGSFWPGSGVGGTVWGGAGDDLVQFTAPVGAEAHGDDGQDLLAVTTSGNFGTASGGHMDFGAGTFTGPGALSLTFDGFERLHFQGNAGADTVIGGAENDTAYLYDGANVADMGAGNDTVAVRYGTAQTLEGGAGDDLLIVMDATFPVYFVVDGLDGDVDDGQLSSITGFERFDVFGSDSADVISLGAGNDSAWGYGGADTLYGQGGDDLLRGWGGRDELHGGDGNDRLNGGGRSDTMYGGAGGDVIYLEAPFLGLGYGDYGNGGAGRDRFVFLAGSHQAEGGAGADIYDFRVIDEGYDAIVGFVSGVDRIRIDADALPGFPGPGGYTFTRETLAGTEPQFLYLTSGGYGYLFWDPDGTDAVNGLLIATFGQGVEVTMGDITVY